MKNRSGRFLVRKLEIIIVLAFCIIPACLSVPGGYYNCTLDNGQAILLPNKYADFDVYSFICNEGFELIGRAEGLCSPGNQKPFCLYKKCARNMFGKCTNSNCQLVSNGRCVCSSGEMEWRCTKYGWIAYSLCPQLHSITNMDINYSSSANENKCFPVGTLAIYTCPNQPHVTIARRTCTVNGWLNKEPSRGCACKALEQPPFGRITYRRGPVNSYYPFGTEAIFTCTGKRFLPYRTCTMYGWVGKASINCACKALEQQPFGRITYTRQPVDSYYSFGTTAMIACSGKSSFPYRTCTMDGWAGNTSINCAWSTPPDLPEPTASETPSRHKDEEKTLVIVSATTGAILGTLIVLVIIVTCQRRLHYHRMRRARLRHREDQDAFAAYITYHRDVRFMLPSYDDAINQQEQGQPPTFDEAVANAEAASPSAPSNEATPPSDDSILVSLDLDRLGQNSSCDDEESPPSYSNESRFIRAVRMLFGGRAFTPRAIYCHLVPYVGEANESRDQPSRPNDTSSSELNSEESEEIGNDNEAVEIESSSPDQETRDLNDLLSRAGLC